MAERAGNRKATGRLHSDTSFADEWYGRRMQLLLRAGAGEYLESSPESLVSLAGSAKSDNDMLDEFLGARDQASFNQMKERFEAMPKQMQEGEFNLLPPQTQQLLLGAGYELPDDERDALWKRMLTWDIPLLPEEHFGKVVAWGMAPIRAVGFVGGKIASNVWEYGVMKPSRFATRLGRTGAYLTQKYGGGSPFDNWHMVNPADWRGAWNESKRENDSYYHGTLDQAIDLVGKAQVDLLRAYLADGQQGVFDKFVALTGDEQVAGQRFRQWQETLDTQETLDAIKVLESGKLTMFDASIRGFNHISPYDVSPNSFGGKVIGTVGALGSEILLDPTTWAGGAYVKIFKAIKSGIRGGQYTNRLIDLERRIAMTVRAEERIAGGSLSAGEMFKEFKITNPVTGEVSDPVDEIAEWIMQPKKSRDAVEIGGFSPTNPLRDLWQAAAVRVGTHPFVLRSRARAHNRFIDRVTDAFNELNKHDLLRTKLGLQIGPEWDAAVDAAIEAGELTLKNPIGQLVRDLPGLSPIIEDMLLHHRVRRQMNLVVDQAKVNKDGYWEVVDDFTGEIISEADIRGFHSLPLDEAGEKIMPVDGEWVIWNSLDDPDNLIDVKNLTARSFPALDTHEGYWDFLESTTGWQGLASGLGKVDPEAMWIPSMGWFGEKWVETKQWIRKSQDFYNPGVEMKADLARMTANFLVKQTNYIHRQIWDGIQKGDITLASEIDEAGLMRLLDDTRVSPEADLPFTYTELGLSETDFNKIEKARELAQADAPIRVLQDSEMSDLLQYYESNGWMFKEVDGELTMIQKPINLFGRTKTVFTTARRRLEEDYFNGQIHPAGSQNGELDWWVRTGIIAKASAYTLAYHPAKFAEKLTTYVPKAKHLDLTDPALGVKEFQALVDMGIMADMPRAQIDKFLTDYMMGSEAHRWRVTTEFYLDFLGRSGALLMGGADVTKFIDKFIRHGSQRYGQIADDMVGLHGLGVRNAVFPGQEHLAQFSKSNVIPDYRELAAVTRYMAAYRRMGWGLHLPTIDKFLARTWRPAVLLRLGYVARNGGEELATWWWREGPTNYVKSKLARKAVDMHPVWDEYGRRVMMKGDDVLADGRTVADEVRAPLFWRPFSRLWRSFNEMAGVGDYAITTKAIKESINKNPLKWKFLDDAKKEEIFQATREAVEARVEKRFIGGTSKRLFEFANKKANEFALLTDRWYSAIPGLPSRHKLAERIGRRIDKDHDRRVEAIWMAYTHPTMLDATMKDVLGGYDNYLNYEKNNLDAALRQTGAGQPINHLLKLGIDPQNVQLKYVSTVEPNSVHGLDKSIAVAQRLNIIQGDKASVKFLEEVLHHVPVATRENLRPVAEELLKADPTLEGLVGANPEAIVLTAIQRQDTSILNNALDLIGQQGDIEWIEAVDAFIASTPGEQQWIWEALLNPTIDGVEVGADWNMVSFLLGGQDVSKLSDDFDEIIERANKAYINYLVGTPEGNQFIMSSYRGAAGQSATGNIDMPLPPGMTRLYMPMIPVELAPAYAQAIDSASVAGSEFLNDFIDNLTVRLADLGIDPAEATKAARMLQPGTMRGAGSSVGLSMASQVALIEEWTEVGRHFPVIVGSADDRVATAITETIMDLLEARVGDEFLNINLPADGMIGQLHVNSESLFNKRGLSVDSRPEFSTQVMRNSAVSSTRYDTLAQDLSGGYWNDFYGFEGKEVRDATGRIVGAEGRGVIGAKEFGTNGLANEVMIGVGGAHLLTPAGKLNPITIIDGHANVGTVRIYKDKSGRFILLEEGTEVHPDAKDWFANAELVEEQRVPINGIRAAAEQHAMLVKMELIDLLSSAPRKGAGKEEFFHPWIREVLRREDINSENILRSANDGRWWEKAPKDILGWVPVTDEAGGSIEKAWNSVLRNWFDGVVNPLIGAMVREPLFHHYLMLGFDQTNGVVRNFDRPLIDVMDESLVPGTWIQDATHPQGGYMKYPEGKRIYKKGQVYIDASKAGEPELLQQIGRYTTQKAPHDVFLHQELGGTFDDFDQLINNDLDDFVKGDWQFAQADPDSPASAIAEAIENKDRVALIEAIESSKAEGAWTRVLRLMKKEHTELVPKKVKGIIQKNADGQTIMVKETARIKLEGMTASRTVQNVQDQFFTFMMHKKRVFETHRDVATRRAMTLTGAYIDDHRIRSQFQQMVGTMVPFWFAEDNFLRRVARSINHNPLMLRNLHLTMNAGVYSGLVQEDQFGEKKLIIPGSEIATHAMLSIANKTPIVNSVFGGELGSVVRPTMGLATNIRIIPGYDTETMGRMGFGPLLAAPINYLSGRDPELKKIFEHHLVGGRFGGSATDANRVEDLWRVTWSSVAPALLTRTLGLAGIDGPQGEARNKAKIDVLKFLALNDQIPTEAEIASASNPELFQEAFLEKVDAMAKQYQLLQAMTWFFGTGTGYLADLTLDENWEWNTEFHELLELGMPYEEAYPTWVNNIEARTGEEFNAMEYSPFREGAYEKIPFAVLETTQDANVWLVDNGEFAQTFKMSSAYFMPRKFDVDDDEYVAEAKQRQINMGLRTLQSPEEFLEQLYFNVSYSSYSKRRTTYLKQKNQYINAGVSTEELDKNWDAFMASFKEQHPVFNHVISTGTARERREETLREFRVLLESPHLVPEGLHKEDVLNAIATIVGYADKIASLQGLSTPDAQSKRDAIKIQYLKVLESFTRNKPWLNELFYSVFVPLIGESWLAKYEAGNVSVDVGAMF